MLPCSLFTKCHKVNQIEHSFAQTALGGSHINTQSVWPSVNSHSALYWGHTICIPQISFGRCQIKAAKTETLILK